MHFHSARALARIAVVAFVLGVAVSGDVVGQAADVVIVAGQRIYHAAACSQTAALNPVYLRTVKRDTLGAEFSPCPVCRPDHRGEVPAVLSSATERELEELWSRYDPNEVVTIVVGQRATGLYHRRGCHWNNGGDRQPFVRKEADARYFQPHQECMRRPPDTFTAEAEEALRKGQPTPARALVGVGAAAGSTTSAPAATSSPSTPVRSTARQQCAATTKKGTRCSRLADVGSAFCWQHK